MINKPNVVYIHGCFVGPKYSIFRESELVNGGLYGLLEEVKDVSENVEKTKSKKDSWIEKIRTKFNRVKPKYSMNNTINGYSWAVDRNNYSFWQSCNPFCYLNTYIQESNYILTQEATSKLHQYLLTKNPEIILTHSAGNRLLFETFNQFGFNSNLQKIVTLASDLPADYKIYNHDFLSKLQNRDLIWENYYCFYDQALLFSSIFKLEARTGLIGYKQNLAKNIFYPLKLKMNFHTSGLHDTKFLKKILTI